jgi:CHASE3 domain sensor protein
MNRSWTFGKKIAAGFALSFVLMAMIGIVAYRSINTLANTSQMVAHTHLVLERLADVLNVLQDAEIGGRGYIISGDESFLQPYQHSERFWPPEIR